MGIFPSIIKWLYNKRLEQIDLFRKHPFETQNEVLFRLLARAAETEIGKEYDYHSIDSIEEYQSRVPIRTYEEIAPYITRLRNGESNIFWPGDIRWFAKSAGTTDSKSKFIPITSDALEDCHFRGGKDMLAIYATQNLNTGIFRGKGLTLGGSHRVNKFSNDSLYGDLSAILIENAPFWVDIIRTPKTEIALLEDFEEKLAKLTQSTVNENVTSLSGVPSWYLVLLNYVLDFTGKNNILEVWPNLEIFFHGGINFEPYRNQFKTIIPSDRMNYMESYNASEGFFGLQDDPGSSDMLLMLDLGIFFEFIPASKIGDFTGSPLHIGEVSTGVNYAVVISTNGGLWRYMIGDTITFTSLYPHKFRITGRTRHFINAFGEEVIMENAEKSISAACRETGAVVSEYTAGPVYMAGHTKGSHEWIIEFEKEPDSLTKFIKILDLTLQSVNSDYEAKRKKDITLLPPVVRIVPRGTFIEWFRRNNKLGGQNKMPRLSNDRQYIEEFYGIAGINK